MPDALLVSGGNDIGPELYGEPINPKVKIDSDRDKLEMQWIRTALDHGWPLLGICRGAQLINVVLGGTLYTDIRALRRRTYNRPSLLPTKQVAVEQSSFLHRVVRKTRLRVNSLHHQAVNMSGSNLRVVGRDLDEFCQAFEGTLPQRIIGVQWHPEYLFYLPAQLRLFRWLVNAARS
ncbi:peptidase C26 [Luminiphilus syltensis NOR5-1B]|uniref:Peptidase C26 n=1 Tax=Luminiphilus syltensis NOR5-1B TaxID=565045 RepID=B8KXB0_9GAMM|nr:gamma-glutamyl-gamma-aminobutyrate hydrolase family protein [Luminiphilus syltensis]EED35842.1 peptidase C26 [Luminiphilus syltensis NOR5-1B]